MSGPRRGARTRYRAAWVVPITSPPVRDGWIDVDDGRIVAVGGPAGSPPAPDTIPRERDLGSTALLPGLVNAHTHLELSVHRGAVPPADRMPTWARALMRRIAAGVADGPGAGAMTAAIVEMRQAGTALVADVTNTLASLAALDAGPIDAVVFHELLGFDLSDEAALAAADRVAGLVATRLRSRVRLRAAAHAPYSVAPALFRALVNRVPGPRSVHLGESREEVEFLRDGGGVWREVLAERGRWTPAWRPPRAGPVDYLAGLGWVGEGTLAVHGVQLTRSELARLADAGTTVVTCPRSNQWTGAGIPPLATFYDTGVAVAVGTDSLASVADLNVFAELAEMRRLAPAVPASRLLESATRVGARALGWGATHGAIEVDRPAAAVIAVALSGPVPDVEEYLVRGIDPGQVSWLEDEEAGSSRP